MVRPPAQRARGDDRGTAFGAELRRLRQERKLSLGQLAERAHYSRGQLSKIENGVVAPTPELARACDDALEANGALMRLVAPRPPRTPKWTGTRLVDLPPATRIFVGRQRELDQIVAGLSITQPPATRFVVLRGAPGSGKTQLAIQAAGRLLDQYPDGCLYLDLRGEGTAIGAADAMDRLLRRVGVPAEAIPPEPVERAALYRRVTRDRRLLLVLDNPACADDVLELVIPGTAAGVLVVTRARLRALDDAIDVRLGPLAEDEARVLFGRIAGDDVDLPAALVDRIVRACGWMPLAVRIAAARLRPPHQVEIDELVKQLEHPDHSLAALDDGSRSVARTFADSWSAMPDAQGRLFAVLSVHPGATFDAWAAATMVDSPVGDVRRALRGLVDASLLELAGPERYAFHDLIRSVAAHYATTTLSADDRNAARIRLLSAYLTAAQQADVAVTPSRHREPVVSPPPSAPPAPFDSPSGAAEWLAVEQDNLVRAIETAAQYGEHDTCWKLAYAIRDHLFRTMAIDAWVRSHTTALAAARRTGDLWAVAVTLNNLGLAYALSHRPDEADRHYVEALDLFRGLGDTYGEANTLGHLAWTAYLRTDYAVAQERARSALAIYQDQQAVRNIAITLRTLAQAEAALGQTEAAITHLGESLDACIACGLVLDEAMTLNCLGEVTGDASAAAGLFVRSWWRARAGGSVFEQVRALRGMATAAASLGRPETAARLSAYAASLGDPGRWISATGEARDG